MKKTHKLQVLGDVAGIIASAPNLSVAAKRLGVNRSTVHRWLQAGKVQRIAPKTGPAAGAAVDETPEGWSKAVLAAGDLDVTQGRLLDLAVSALGMARDVSAQPALRLSAMGRYQQLVKQLNLTSEARQADKPAERAPMAHRRTGADPRAVLMAVK